MKYKIYLFRHGQTYYNKNKVFTGWKDSKLTPLGMKQARIIAKKLKNKNIGMAFDNSLIRSKQTLKEVLKFHPECRKVISDKRMIERRYGKLEGKFHEKIIKKYGQKQFELWHRGYNSRPLEGESFADVEKRVRLFIEDLKKTIKKEKVNIAISASGNSIRIFRKIIEKASEREAVKWIIPYTKIFVYEL